MRIHARDPNTMMNPKSASFGVNKSLLPSVMLLLIASGNLSAQPWKQFRGPAGGKVAEVYHPSEWSAESNMAWSVPMKGSGWSSPLVVANRVFLTAAEAEDGSRPKGMAGGVASMRSFRSAKPGNHRFVVMCLDLMSGQTIWQKQVAEAVPPVVHPSNTYATESPVTDDKTVVTFFATTGTLTAWDLAGTELWRQELGRFTAGRGFGTGSSLAIYENRVFVQFDNDENSFVAAFDIATGNSLWRDERPAKTSWSTPLIWSNGKRTELVTCGSDVVTSYDPTSGDVLWKLTGMQSAFSGSPAIDADRIYFGNSGPGSAGPLVAVKAGTEGVVELDQNFESDRIAWSRTRSGPGMASPIVANGKIYIPTSGGLLNCYDAESGERLYRQRVQGMKTVVASLWGDDNRVFILDENGTTRVIGTGDEYQLLATNSLDDLVWSTPTVVGDTLLIRGVEKLYCISK